MNYKPLLPENVKYLVVHCAATPPSADIGAKEIDRWHRARGFFQIGYHKVIRRNGVIEDGRPLDMPGAHARGFNHLSIGVCLVGGVAEDGKTPENNFTDEQWPSLRVLLKELKVRFPNATILGHRDLPDVHKACPSFGVREYLKNNPLD